MPKNKESEPSVIERYCHRKTKYLLKLKLCGLMMYISYVIVYSLRNILNAVVIAKQTPIAKCFSLLFFIAPITFVMFIFMQKLLSKYSIEKVLDYALICFAFYLLTANFILIYLRNTIENKNFVLLDSTIDGKIEYKRAQMFYIMLSMTMPSIITLQYSIINIYEAFVQYVLMFLIFNEIFTHKQFNEFMSIVILCETLAIFTSSIISFLHQKLFFMAEHANREFVNIVFYNVIMLLSFFLFFVFRSVKNILDKEKEDKKQLQEKMDDLRNRSVPGTSNHNLLRFKFVRSMCLYVIAFFILHELAYISFESSIFDKAMAKFQSIMNAVIDETNTIRAISSLLVLSALALLVPIWLVQRRWKVLAYSAGTWAIMGYTCQCLFDMVIKGSECKSLNCVNRICTILNLKKNMLLRTDVLRVYDIVLNVSLILLRFFKIISFLIIKETLMATISKEIRHRTRIICDGLCPLIGKAIASIVVLSIAEVFNSYDARSISPILLLFAFMVYFFWLCNLRYLIRRYNNGI